MEPIKTEEEYQKRLYEFLKNFIHENYPQPFVSSPDVMEERQKICNSCEHKKPLKNKCGLCGCHIDGKVMSCLERCPDGRWDCDFDGFVATCYNSIEGKLNEGIVI